MLLRSIAVAGLVVAASAAHSQVIFSDGFDSDTVGENVTTFVGGWTVSDGTVDVIGAGTGSGAFFDLLPGNGNYIDLDGSTTASGVFSKSLMLTGGTTYNATFQLAGSQRTARPAESANVTFGTVVASYTYDSFDKFKTSTLTFTPTVTGTYALTFDEPGLSNVEGLLLDNVSVTAAVPEPGSYALLLAGLASMGFIARRRRQGF